jgi:hypothetical protein
MVGYRTFWLAQQGNSPGEYQDAFAADSAAGRYAVADGVTQSGFARAWARLLATAFVADRAMPEAFVARLPELQTRWRAELPAALDWLAEEKAQEGAFATFLGVAINDSPRPPGVPGSMEEGQGVTACSPRLLGEGQGVRGFHWQAIAVGDACLFHTRADKLCAAFPMDRSEAFTNVPRSLGSRTAIAEYWQKHAMYHCGQALPGDRLWLATDALAQWILAECEAGGNPWAEMERALLPSPACRTRQDGRGAGGEGSEFAEWIAALRNRPSRRLRNDDVTLLAIPLDEPV